MDIIGSPNDPRTPKRPDRHAHFPSLNSPFKYMSPAELMTIYQPTHVASETARPAIQPDLDASSPARAPANPSGHQKKSKTRGDNRQRVAVARENVPPIREGGIQDESSRAAPKSVAKRKPVQMEDSGADNQSGDDADEEERQRPRKRTKRSKKMKRKGEEAKVLSVETDELDSKQLATRRELKKAVRIALLESTGYNPPGRDVPAATPHNECTPFDFTELVCSPTNSRIISKIVKLDLELSSLTYQYTEVQWTKRDLSEFAKGQFRSWRSSFQATTSDEKAAAAAQRKRKNKRDIRHTHLAKDRQAAALQYKQLHGLDPSPYIDEAWMSDQISGIETEDEGKAAAYLGELQEKAAFSPQDIEEDRAVWEVIKKGFRSERINDVISELDRIRAVDRRKSKKKTSRARRVDLGQVNNHIPLVQVYQSMVDRDWFQQEVEAKGLEDELLIIDEASGLTEEEEDDEEDDEDGEDNEGLSPRGMSPPASSGLEATPALEFPASDGEEE
ncbi:hypothetical protein HWV62_20047 [Athelia sp. TMB]|nr:hypothetical protein HWV62_20047 [Athelia sp. TMB]